MSDKPSVFRDRLERACTGVTRASNEFYATWQEMDAQAYRLMRLSLAIQASADRIEVLRSADSPLLDQIAAEQEAIREVYYQAKDLYEPLSGGISILEQRFRHMEGQLSSLRSFAENLTSLSATPAAADLSGLQQNEVQRRMAAERYAVEIEQLRYQARWRLTHTSDEMKRARLVFEQFSSRLEDCKQDFQTCSVFYARHCK